MESETQSFSIKCWAEEDRPREKLILKGRHTLSDAELIAILIGSGTREESAVELSKKILSHLGNSLNELGKLSVNDLKRFKGIGEAKAISIIAALELGRRRKEADITKRSKVTCSKEIFEILHPHFSDLPYEEFHILMLNRANQVIKREFISRGGIAGTVVDQKIIFKTACEHLASSIILCHNHPSGNLKPSDADIKLTKKIKEASHLLDITLLDHIIIGENSYYSFADEGVL